MEMARSDVRTRSMEELVSATMHTESGGGRAAAESPAKQAVGCRSANADVAVAAQPSAATADLSSGVGDLDSSSAQPELPPPTLTVAETSATVLPPPSVGSSSGSSSSSRKRGRGRPPSCSPATTTDSRLTSYLSPKDGTEYLLNDFVYLEANKPNEPYKIGRVKEFVVSKRDSLIVNVSRFYRSSEIPEQVYLRLLQDRSSELSNELADVIVNVQTRELFQSEKLDSYRASALRGKCTVVQFQDAYAARSFLPSPDTFFTTLRYNPDTRRLATIQGEIRIGASHQARLPECRPDIRPEDRDGESTTLETLLWRPGRVCDDDVLMYLGTARSTAAFAGMCERGGSASDGVRSACRDDTTQNAMNMFHAANYNRDAALTALVRSPLAQSVDRRWSDEDSKKFMKGLRIYGKNFFKIRKELLPHKETSHLVEYYYYWKKLPVAFSTSTRRRSGFLRRQSARPATSEEQSSSSISDESEFDGPGEILCVKCDATIPSKAWHQAPDRCYLCEDCSERYKKYGSRDETSDDSGGASAGSSAGALSDYVFKPLQPDASPAQPVECKVVVAASPVAVVPRVKEATASLAAAAASDRELQPSSCIGDSASVTATAAAFSSSSSLTKTSPPPKKARPSPAGRAAAATTSAASPFIPADGAVHVSRSTTVAACATVSSQAPFVPPIGLAVPCLAPLASVPSASDAKITAAVGRAEGSESVIVSPTRSLLPVAAGGSLGATAPRQSVPFASIAAGGTEAEASDDAAESDDSEDVRLSSLIKVEPGSRSGSATPPSFGGEPSPSSPVVIEQKCHESRNALFFRVIGRLKNSCSRSDIIFKPPPDHSFAKMREQRLRSLVAEVKVKEERRDERPTERSRDHGYLDAFAVVSSSSTTSSRSYRPSSSAATAVPSSSSGAHCSSSTVVDRSSSGTPRLFSDPTASPYYPLGISAAPGLGPCLTPALMHLGHLARPHSTFSVDDYPRHLTAMQSFDAFMQHQQAHSRLFGSTSSGASGSGGGTGSSGNCSSLFPLPPTELRPSSVAPLANSSALPHEVRERLEASWKSSQEAIGSRELFEMHIREKQSAAAAAAAAAGLNNPFLDPLFREQLQLQQLRMAAGGALPPGMTPPALSAIMYQSQLAAAAAAAAAAATSSSGESARDRMPRLGYPSQAQTVPPTSESPLSIGERVGFPPPPAHLSHTHTHTHVHVHQPTSELAAAAAAAPFLPPHLLSGAMAPAAAAAAAGPFIPPGIDPSALAALMGMGGGAASQHLGTGAAAGGSLGLPGLPSPYGLPPAAAAAAYQHSAAAAAALLGLPPLPPGGVGLGRSDNPFDYIGRHLDPLLTQPMQQLPPHVQQELQRQALDRDRFVAAMAAAAEASRH